jgi:hypothetical protein
MSVKHRLTLVIASLLSLMFALGLPSQARAETTPPDEPSNCIACHEDLYYLHDTGKYFCVTEARQRCADCHDGDPSATDKESAHAHRSAHPVVNEDISKCQQCHPSDCAEYVQKFSQIAGISPVFVAPHLPGQQVQLVQTSQPVQVGLPNVTMLFIPILAGAALIILALAAFSAHLRQHA